jgi:hypothetical protein
MQTSKDKFPQGERRSDAREMHLATVWRALIEGRGANKDDFELLLADLSEFTGFFFTAADTVTNEQLQRMEGRREVMGRILYLLDFEFSIINELRRAALTELHISTDEAQR